MAMLGFLFSCQLWEATSSIPVMKMLAEQAENNVERAVTEACKPGAIIEGVYDDYNEDEYGEPYYIERTYYSCGSCLGTDHDEVKLEYIHLISQLTRRSAFLTIFGLFEHHMNECLKLMLNLSGYTGKLKGGAIEKTHTMLTKVIGEKGIVDVDHLTIIRNIMAHSDGIASGYHESLVRKSKKTEAENRLLQAIRRVEIAGISVNDFDGVLMDDTFLMYAIGEIKRYVESLEAAVQTYHKKKA
ncbi:MULTISPECIES: hypothetical protein [Serratia]|uniref:hypothetical protein n=1 Tax=Serratia TaxID=613 RepID=UPI0003617BF7|nr:MULTISPECIES: hypothetical protein [Serratia]RYM48334.1 hypothetical protein BSQ96_22185 [Serratia proteamaculans]